ncbi:MAG: hypoxanthine phosphoribosyltransferase [Rikenellaceae bacterium]|jgi:hypoxanthine phosphoribosyltransferase|nr:hypoxanthine phosphoribosyltransferase [Rikenellaceae bacterium]
MKRVTLHDKTFEISIPNAQITAAIDALAARINADYADRPVPLFLGVLNGAFMFMGELVQRIDFACEVSFVKLASYRGTRSTGSVTELIGLTDNIRGRDVIVVEDIVDTGESVEHILRSLIGHEPASVKIATLLFKPAAVKPGVEVAYSALSIPNDFIVGFGLDYNQLGRNLPDIYTLVNE